MKVDDLHPSIFLKASDIPQPVLASILKVSIEEVFDEQKPVLRFIGNNLKPMVLNKTNASTIAAIYGDETDAWQGKQIVLFSSQVPFQGKMVDSIRLRAPKARPAAPPPPPPPPAAADPAGEDGEPPF